MANTFQGIHVFNNNNASTYSDNPSIAGTYLGFYWAQLEPSKGVYNWDLIDQAMKPWVANGKQIDLRVSTSAWKKWQPAQDSGNATPRWVYDLGVRFVTETDGAVKPEYWNPLFLSNLSDFIAALAARYDGHPNIAVIEMGIGDGGETKPDTMNNGQARLSQWKAIGYSDQVWMTTIQDIAGFYIANFKKTPLALMPNASFIGGTKGYDEQMVIDFAVEKGLWLQDNGLTAAEKSWPGSWKNVKPGYPYIAEQRNDTASSGDTLDADLAAAMALGARIALVFASDIANPKNAQTLTEYAAKATSVVVGSGSSGSTGGTGSTGGNTGGSGSTGTGTGGVVCPCPCCPLKLNNAPSA